MPFDPGSILVILILVLAGCDPGVIGVGGPVSNAAPADPCGGRARMSEPPSPMLSADCKIVAGSCPHLGDDPIHNICADVHARNVIWDGAALANGAIPMSWYASPPEGRAGNGCDAKMGERNLDALSWDSRQEHPVVWEVKTEIYDGKPEFIRGCILNRAIERFIEDCMIVTACNRMIDVPEFKIRYNYATWDEVLYRDLTDYLAAHPAMLPAGATEFCNVDNASPCKNGPQP